jgi:transglutaminase-like putative cysteine protease
MKRRIPLAPEEGWLTLGLVLLMCLTLAWSVDGGRYVLGRDAYLDYLVFAAAGGVIAGFVGAKVGWGRWLTYLIGAMFAALIVPLLTGLLAYPAGASLHDLYTATAAASVAAYIDIAIRGQIATVQYLHHVMIIGLIVWATSMFASFAVFGHRRALNAVVVVGVLLVVNMAVTLEDQLPLLVVFSLASLFLLIRAHVFDEQSEWLRRRIGDPASISTVYLRGGTTFIAITVTLAFVLTQTAASKPLAGAWSGVGDGLISLTRAISKYMPTGGSTRSLGISFGSNSQIGQVWSSDPSLAVTIRRPAIDDGDYYWRAAVYDEIELRGWGQSDAQTLGLPARTPLFEGLADDPTRTGLHSLTFVVIPAEFREPTMLSPQTPVEVDEPVRLTYVGEAGYFATMERDGGGEDYEITAEVPIPGNAPGQLNVAALRATETTYPAEIVRLYTGLADDILGPNARALKAKILADAKSRAPIDLADQLVKELHSSAFEYRTDVRHLDCANLSIVECFATYRQGYCQYYAATMAVILRDFGVPTRIAEGFLPGTREAGIERILNSNAHAWVEVYFPGYGWVPFDPTGGALPGQIGPLPSGPPQGSAAPGPSATFAIPSGPTRGDGGPVPGQTGGRDQLTPGSVGPLIAVTVLLLLVMGGLAFVVWQRGPRGATTADAAYGMVTRIASRLGFGPRPTQTVYEYAGTLGEVLPDVRPELETVARAKVESVYARQHLGEDRLVALRAAQRRLRVALLRLIIRRKERRRRRH